MSWTTDMESETSQLETQSMEPLISLKEDINADFPATEHIIWKHL